MKGDSLKNTFSVKDKDGKVYRVNKNDPRYLNGELVGINKNMVIVIDKNNKKFKVSKNDPRYLCGELVGHTRSQKCKETTKILFKNNVAVVDDHGNKYYVSKTDERYLNGELKHIFQDKISVKDKDGKVYRVNKNDPRYLNGELVGVNKNKHVTKEVKNKISSSFNNKRQIKYKNFNYKIEKNEDVFLIKNYCEHGDIKISPRDFNKLYKLNKPHYCEKCNEKLIQRIVNNNSPTEFFEIPKCCQETHIKRFFPNIYANIIKNTTNIKNITFTEKLYLYKNKLTYKPKCKFKNCNNETEYSYFGNTYVYYCNKHKHYYTISIKEHELFNFIKSFYNKEIILSYRKLKYELDIYLPDINLSFEFNGIYWHSDIYRDKYYHHNKWKVCYDNNIKLITIWEDDWNYKQDIIKSMIKNQLQLTENRIYGRNCMIKEINYNESKSFLENNHLQGSCKSKINLGLFYHEKLVSLMTFGKRRMILNSKSKNENEYELLRFCNKLNTAVIGGASKLLTYFEKKYTPQKIISYINLDIGNGQLYEKLNFKIDNKITISYWWVDNIRHHRSNFMKHKLVKEGYDCNKTEDEIMKNRGFRKIWNTGNIKYEKNYLQKL